jgi:Zinc carboxypeptidase
MFRPRHQLILVTLLAVGLAGSLPSARTRAAAPGAPAPAVAQMGAGHITTPKEEWGHNVGDDYFLADYKQLDAYWHKLQQESPRIHVVDIGPTAEGRHQYMAVITSPENYAKLDHYREISARLSNAEGLTDAEAQALAKEGKAVVWIDGGLHATETLGAQQLLEMVYQMVSRTDDETQRFLNDVILLCTAANPDGMDLVSDWYMQHGSMSVPVLWNHYAGHDDNRDSFMNALPETTNVSRVMYREWYPQIMYNHHQSGPAGAVMFAPPFRDPFNYNFHPEVPADIDMIGAVIATRAIEEGKPGVVNRDAQSYSTWWNGGYRTTAYFHNQIGILTETIGSPNPSSVPFVTRFAIGNMSNWFPITPQAVWHFRQSIDYSITANRAVLDFASRYRETLLYRIYEMGRDEIKYGSEDHWTFTPHELSRVEAEVGGGAGAGGGRGGGRGGGGFGGRGGGGNGQAIYDALTTKALRDPRGFIMPSDQPDFDNAVAFVNALIKSGITVLRATAPFTVQGKAYPAGSLVVKTAQAFRPHVMDMFEPQDYPDDFAYPGAPPTRPYDDAGYTLAFQMGVTFDRILDGFDGPFEKLAGLATMPAGSIKGAQSPVGYYFTHQATNSFVAVNRLVAANEDVSWLWNGPMGYGTFYVAAKPTTRAILQKAAQDLGLTFEATTTAPTGPSAKLRKLRIGLVDHYGGGMPVGWTRLIFKNFEFPYAEDVDDVYAPTINAGNLNAKYDVLVFNNESLGVGGGRGGRGGRGANAAGGRAGAPPAAGGGRGAGTTGAVAGAATGRGGPGGRQGGGGRGGGCGTVPDQPREPGDDRPPFQPIPEKYVARCGSIDADGVAALKAFVENGGTIIAIGNSANGAVEAFDLPLTNHLVKSDGSPLGSTDYYVPGSVLRVAVDPKNPLAHGYGNQVDVFFSNNPVWSVANQGEPGNVHAVAWFADGTPLRSGWAWGQKYLDKGVEMAEASVGKGRVFLFGNELLFRSQPHGDFKFFFNALYLSVAPGMKAGLGQ